MIFFAALLLMLGPVGQPVDQEFELGPDEYRWVPFTVRQTPSEIELRFQVQHGAPTIHAEILAIDEFRQFNRGKPHDAIASTPNAKAAGLRRMLYTRGEYAVVLVNAPRAQNATVSLGMRVDASPKGAVGQELPPGKRWMVILSSLLFLTVTAGWSGRRLLLAMRRNRGD